MTGNGRIILKLTLKLNAIGNFITNLGLWVPIDCKLGGNWQKIEYFHIFIN